jgi:hypothetical protein
LKFFRDMSEPEKRIAQVGTIVAHLTG